MQLVATCDWHGTTTRAPSEQSWEGKEPRRNNATIMDGLRSTHRRACHVPVCCGFSRLACSALVRFRVSATTGRPARFVVPSVGACHQRRRHRGLSHQRRMPEPIEGGHSLQTCLGRYTGRSRFSPFPNNCPRDLVTRIFGAEHWHASDSQMIRSCRSYIHVWTISRLEDQSDTHRIQKRRRSVRLLFVNTMLPCCTSDWNFRGKASCGEAAINYHMIYFITIHSVLPPSGNNWLEFVWNKWLGSWNCTYSGNI